MHRRISRQTKAAASLYRVGSSQHKLLSESRFKATPTVTERTTELLAAKKQADTGEI
ncbi:MAG: hypothetical protein JOZ52_04795 [Acidobacteria bacterium]|nr:hypothetical protein [Acidobacteriota bacterium]